MSKPKDREADQGVAPKEHSEAPRASGTIRLCEPGVLSELKRKITPSLYCDILGRNLEHNFKKCPKYQPIRILSRTTRAISYQGSPGRPRPERKEELHYCVLCQHSRSIKDRPH